MSSPVARLAIVALLFAGACRQGAGQTCEVNADCDDGLVCTLAEGQMLASGGTCQPKSLPDAATADLIAAPDMAADMIGGADGATDGATDAAMSDMTAAPDLTAGDGGAPDQATSDAAPPADAGGVDATGD